MGYCTTFEGAFHLDRRLTAEHHLYLDAFNEIRHVIRDVNDQSLLNDQLRINVNLPVGKVGEFTVCNISTSISNTDYNNHPYTQPALWCGWRPSDDGMSIEWDREEKFYRAEKWIRYIVENFMVRWGYELNGEVKFQGEDPDDRGYIIVNKNRVSKVYDKIITIYDSIKG